MNPIASIQVNFLFPTIYELGLRLAQYWPIAFHGMDVMFLSGATSSDVGDQSKRPNFLAPQRQFLSAGRPMRETTVLRDVEETVDGVCI